jgi:hypothetical protein
MGHGKIYLRIIDFMIIYNFITQNFYIYNPPYLNASLNQTYGLSFVPPTFIRGQRCMSFDIRI